MVRERPRFVYIDGVCRMGPIRVSVSESGHARFEGGGGAHDDLVLAVALALWRLMALEGATAA
jgi:hypothetical protein